MTEAEWLGRAAPGLMLRFLGGRASERKLRLFACHCAELVLGSMLQRDIPPELELAWVAADDSVRPSDPAVVVAEQSVLGSELAESYAGRTLEAAFRPRQRALAESRNAVESLAIRLASDAGRDTARASQEARTTLASFLRDIFGNPFRKVKFKKTWRTDTAVTLARQMYEAREFSAMPILADALQDAGCDNEDVLNHCRDTNQVHVRGCWVVDLVLEKE